MRGAAAIGALALGLSGAPAAPAGPAEAAGTPGAGVEGVWSTEPRSSGAYLEIEIAPCNGAPERRCGTIVGAHAGADPGFVGNPIITGMAPDGPGRWRDGEIIRPGSGTRYSSSLEVEGDRLKVKGCAVAGLFCGESVWVRVR
ncbi:DUF2147 domain-containing protein [Paralimibaculum aggregatum]|uniref:DUF2147 domain-containing protein n=1 Tax=Paralimibaculum aggregatum TaxID=3036245 RepID=A0ABQ6LL90_9RHOB|nr:DUF2147 domain-containing protein [Limibaculum sp. NKW23]GMG81186.1 DUF2147 domain-containing protein [Limibaculum sp. NKW23]